MALFDSRRTVIRVSKAKYQTMIGKILKKFWKNHSNGNYLRLMDTNKPFRARPGHVVIYVGPEAERYQVPLRYLSFPEVEELIKEVEEDELDIKISGPLQLRCTHEEFKGVLQRAKDFYALSGPSGVVSICYVDAARMIGLSVVFIALRILL